MIRVIHTSVFASIALAKRLNTDAGNGPHKCTIRWEVPERGVAAVSFPVKSCRLHCQATNFDYNHDVQFTAAFKVEESGQSCQCLSRDGERVLKFFGDCESPDASKSCWQDYQMLRTNEYVRDYGRETTHIVKHLELQKGSSFDYTQCENNACTSGDCYASAFPSIVAGRSDDEKQIMADILKKFEAGESLHQDEKDLIEGLADNDIAELLGPDHMEELDDTEAVDEDFLEEMSDPEDDERERLYSEIVEGVDEHLTVAILRKIYYKKLAGTAVSVDHMLVCADLVDDDQLVDLDSFVRFLKPSCE